jgi:histidinol-phosphate aminotransferase
MPHAPQPQPGISQIDLYVGGAAHVEGVTDIVKLSSNENPLGASPAALAAAAQAAQKLHLYPNTDHTGLRTAIGEVYGLDPSRILCGAGSDEIITFLCNAYAGPGDEVIYTEHGFSMYRISALAAGATPVEVRENARTTDVDAILAAVTPRTRLVFVANPNNPTGTMIDLDSLRRLAEGLPDGCMLVIDGAYAEFVEGYDSGAALARDMDNVFMTRTFSKIYGLGGLRVGWGYGAQSVIDTLNRIRGPFNLSHIALATAEAAIRDTDYTEHCRAENARARADLVAGLDALGLPSDPSEANFVLARFASGDAAGSADAALRARGVIVRRVAGYKLPAALRITVGDDAGVARVLAALRAWRETGA